MITDGMVEAAARALFAHTRKRGQPLWDRQIPEFHDHMRASARAALEAALSQKAEGEAGGKWTPAQDIALDLIRDRHKRLSDMVALGRRVQSADVAALLGDVAALLAPLPRSPQGVDRGTGARWHHKKRGSTYVEVGRGELQTDNPVAEGTVLVVYQCETDGKLWVRPDFEFDDGRFKALPALPREQDGAGAVGNSVTVDRYYIQWPDAAYNAAADALRARGFPKGTLAAEAAFEDAWNAALDAMPQAALPREPQGIDPSTIEACALIAEEIGRDPRADNSGRIIADRIRALLDGAK